MPFRWKIFRFFCVIQLLAAAIFGIVSLINFLMLFAWGDVLRLFLYFCIFLLALFSIQLVGTHYPDIPVAGQKKTQFNRLYLLNFLLLSFLFAIVFSNYKEVRNFAAIVGRPLWELPPLLFLPLTVNVLILTIHLGMLYGLFVLRRELYSNCMRRQFDFENNSQPPV